jgi:ELWxxDGT repeat protein
VAGTLYFAAYTTKSGFQVWKSDGTSSGTVMDTSLNTGSSHIPSDLGVMGSSLFFTAPGATLWDLS